MDRYLVIDNRMRQIEKQCLARLGYKLVEIPTCNYTYNEISSHVDIFCTKIKDKFVIEKNIFDSIDIFRDIDCVSGEDIVGLKYPNDIKYNVCVIGNCAIHNFKYTDKKVLQVIDELGLAKIDIKQGYSKCSIAVINDSSCIVTDKHIANTLKECNIDVLLIEDKLDIKLLNHNTYSAMTGFVGGCISRLGDNIFVSGDLEKIDKCGQIKEFIQSKNLNIIDFPQLDVVDYGGIFEI